MPGLGDLTEAERIAAGLKSPEQTIEQKPTWNLFPSFRERRRFYECFMDLTNFVHDEKIANVIFLDRSARPAYLALKECWKIAHPDEPRPGMFFMNPLGFMSRDKTAQEKLKYQAFRSLGTGEKHIRYEQPRLEAAILKDLQTTYQALLAESDRPMMIFDVCMHSGNNVVPVKKALEKVGCHKLFVGTMNEPPPECAVTADFFHFPEEEGGVCHPFGAIEEVKKSFESVSSRKNSGSRPVERALATRKEIKALIEEQRAAHAKKQMFEPLEDRF